MNNPMVATLNSYWIDFFCLKKKFLVFNFVSRNLKTKYHRSVLGMLWTVLTPLSMAGVYYMVFRFVFRVEIPHYMVFILSGVIPWTFFAQSVMDGMESIVGSLGLVSRVPVPLQAFAYTNTITNFITLLLSVPIIFAAGVFSGTPINATLLLIPLFLGILFLFTYSLAFILSVLFVFFRDLRHLFSIFLQIWFYLTPVIYQESMIPERFHWVLYANPMSALFVAIRSVLIRGEIPSPPILLAILIWTLAIVLPTMIYQKHFLRGIVERI